MAGALPSFNGKQIHHSFPRLNRGHPWRSDRAMVGTMSNSNNESYWTSINSDIEANLKQAIPIRPPISVFQPMHCLTFGAPQTTAPALCIAACELVGGHRDQAMAAASALHLMQAAALTRENLLWTDRLRPKMRPNNSHAFGPNIELLTGDGLISFGYELLAKSNNPAQNNSERILRAIVEIARATGAQRTIEGQYNELERDKSKGEKSFQGGWIDRVCKKKEGEIHACAGACGAILGGGSEEEIERLRMLGLYLGMIQGASNIVLREDELIKEVNKLRQMALEELKHFDQGQVEAILTLLM